MSLKDQPKTVCQQKHLDHLSVFLRTGDLALLIWNVPSNSEWQEHQPTEAVLGPHKRLVLRTTIRLRLFGEPPMRGVIFLSVYF